ncbi:hypothetical protein EDB29_1011101 [Vibrio crassostreae]|uniref:phage baseplate plug family protein n=1 Tax=Vibrio crassostreae TaxID=246167 RepID=UPI00104B4A3D|nr:hypothetical protein [Vibrio crassostreae]CAH6851394.1 conserved hypothetical protein [Vibrio chagasii]TCT44289.1 hypothetical protein EDB29_1011101 [Vibrio crassostreae]CAH6863010.1 conserved hypothetical protein [Vibrio chagasii]CAH6928551.1 conserved hypothetical protein [Vibrio chagasii]CAH6947971.1 conserved hypothetical protein [Vibrio chagasii]
MVEIELINQSNQRVSHNVDGVYYEIVIKDIDGEMAYSVSVDGESIVEGFRFSNMDLLLPYKYMEINGNFYLRTEGDERADYKKFGITQRLFFITLDELEGVRDN